MLTRSIALAALISLTLATSASAGEGNYAYTVTDLGGMLAGVHSCAYGINNAGQIVGGSGPGDRLFDRYQCDYNGSHAFLYSNGAMTDLGTMGEAGSVAFGINNAGQVVGEVGSNFNSTYPSTRAFLYSNGTMTTVNDYGDTCATAINDAGQITVNTRTSAYVWYNGSMSTVDANGTGMQARCINNSGQVGGWGTLLRYRQFYGYIEQNRGFIRSNGTTSYVDYMELWYSDVADINDTGDAVGTIWFSSCSIQPFLYHDGDATTLEPMGPNGYEIPEAINNAGDVVGTFDTGEVDELDSNSTMLHAFLYHNGVTTDLNSLVDPNSGWTIERAYDINDSGQIVGYGRNALGDQRAFLLTPVPEPTTLVLAAMGMLVLRRKR